MESYLTLHLACHDKTETCKLSEYVTTDSGREVPQADGEKKLLRSQHARIVHESSSLGLNRSLTHRATNGRISCAEKHRSLSEDFTSSYRDEALDLYVTFCSHNLRVILYLCFYYVTFIFPQSLCTHFFLDGPAMLSRFSVLHVTRSPSLTARF